MKGVNKKKIEFENKLIERKFVNINFFFTKLGAYGYFDLQRDAMYVEMDDFCIFDGYMIHYSPGHIPLWMNSHRRTGWSFTFIIVTNWDRRAIIL